MFCSSTSIHINRYRPTRPTQRTLSALTHIHASLPSPSLDGVKLPLSPSSSHVKLKLRLTSRYAASRADMAGATARLPNNRARRPSPLTRCVRALVRSTCVCVCVPCAEPCAESTPCLARSWNVLRKRYRHHSLLRRPPPAAAAPAPAAAARRRPCCVVFIRSLRPFSELWARYGA